MNQEFKHEMKQALEKERDIIITELKGIAHPNKEMADTWEATYPKFENDNASSHSDMEENQDEFEEYEERIAAEQSLASRLLMITRGLDRIHHGQYGICLSCGKNIPEERLRANPAAEYDIKHEPAASL